MIYELRIYHVAPGKMQDLHARFIDYTLSAWGRHGIKQVGFWTVSVGPDNNVMYYMLQWSSMGERQERFAAFQADPQWISDRASTEQNGVLVHRIENYFLDPTSYSATQ